MGYRDNLFEDGRGNHGWYTCVRCGKKMRKGDMDVDHIIPQSRGGWDSADNLQCMCKHCNRSKNNNMGDTAQDYARNNYERAKQKTSGLFEKIFG